MPSCLPGPLLLTCQMPRPAYCPLCDRLLVPVVGVRGFICYWPVQISSLPPSETFFQTLDGCLSSRDLEVCAVGV